MYDTDDWAGPGADGAAAPAPAEPTDVPEAQHTHADEALERTWPEPPTTGDTDVDTTLAELVAAQGGSLAERIAAGEHAHRSLQGRLGDLGGA